MLILGGIFPTKIEKPYYGYIESGLMTVLVDQCFFSFHKLFCQHKEWISIYQSSTQFYLFLVYIYFVSTLGFENDFGFINYV